MAGGGDLCPTEAVAYGIGLGYTDRELGEEKNWGRKDFFTRKATKIVQVTHTHYNSQLNKRTQEMFEASAYMQHPRSPRTHAHHLVALSRSHSASFSLATHGPSDMAEEDLMKDVAVTVL